MGTIYYYNDKNILEDSIILRGIGMEPKHVVYISVISHNQEDLIMNDFKELPNEIGNYYVKICMIDNTGSKRFEEFCTERDYLYYHDGKTRGFGENHNKAFEICQPNHKDIFIICNPDIILEDKQLEGMIDTFSKNDDDFGNVTCYYNKEKTILSNPDRYFPCLFNFLFSILLGKRFHYGTNSNVKHPEWISGEFMLVRPEAFHSIKGFDEDYFMYVEDIDICMRAQKEGLTISHDKEHYIIHQTQMASRSILSKNFRMHLASVFRFLYKHKRFCLLKSAK